MSAPHNIARALQTIRDRLTTTSTSLHLSNPPHLIAVSKTHSATAVHAAYAAGQRAFGENYVAELTDKAMAVAGMGAMDVRWHFIGHLQSNKCKVVARVAGLYMVESVDSEKLATALDKACQHRPEKLKVLIQVNTSGEASKSGCKPDDAPALFAFVLRQCPHLHPTGLMTIGRLAATPQPDCFEALSQCRTAVLGSLRSEGVGSEGFELSMGMSGDWEAALAAGSTMVRIGSAIFGQRQYGDGAGETEDKNASEAKTAQMGSGGSAGMEDRGGELGEEKSDGGVGR